MLLWPPAVNGAMTSCVSDDLTKCASRKGIIIGGPEGEGVYQAFPIYIYIYIYIYISISAPWRQEECLRRTSGTASPEALSVFPGSGQARRVPTSGGVDSFMRQAVPQVSGLCLGLGSRAPRDPPCSFVPCEIRVGLISPPHDGRSRS